MMPSGIHKCIQQWIVEHRFDWRDNHAINAQEYQILNWSLGTSRLYYTIIQLSELGL